MTMRLIASLFLGAVWAACSAQTVPEVRSGHVTGVGGVFFKAQNPKALAAWYHEVLGLPVQAWGGAVLRYDAAQHPPALAWGAFPASSKHFAPSTGNYMINYAVDDMDAMVARLHKAGVEILERTDDDANGRFVWILDPEGNKLELWEPKRPVQH